MPLVPTPGKNEQSFAGSVVPRTAPGPHGGCFCSSLLPARKCPSGETAMVGSFCLFVGNRAVVLLAWSPATCGWFA